MAGRSNTTAAAGAAAPLTSPAPGVEVQVQGKQILVTVALGSLRVTVAKRNLEQDDVELDPCFFDQDYTIAGSTGFLLWEANWLLLRLLRAQLGQELNGVRVLELGSGTGLAGLCAAALGAHVLLTDLASVVRGITQPNVERNALSAAADATHAHAPRAQAVSHAPPGMENLAGAGGSCAIDTAPWHGALHVGAGSAATLPLDWTEPLERQVVGRPNDPRDAAVILALDTIWLKEIFDAFVGVVMQVLRQRGPGRCVCYLAFVERANEGSKLFVKKEAVGQAFEAQGCCVECLVAEDVRVDQELRPGRVLRVTLLRLPA